LVRSQQASLLDACAESLKQVQGAFSLLLLTKDGMIGVRDPYGFRPLCLGKINGSHVLASESCAFDLINAQYLREIEPGEIVMIRGEEISRSRS
jgi:amidophosphoribosyltransferase